MEIEFELNRGHKRFDAKIKNLIGIFNKLENMTEKLDISSYKNELEEIQEETKKTIKPSSFNSYSDIEKDYYDFALLPYNNKLDDLLKDIEEELLPFYEIYLLYSKIEILITNISNENINEIILKTKELIKSINSIINYSSTDKKTIIEKAYKTIYSVILYEEIFERNDILIYINNLNIPANKENLGRFLYQDLKNINKDELIEEELKALATEGLGFDYLNENLIRKVSRNTVGRTNSEYQRRKEQAISDIKTRVDQFSNKKNQVKEKLERTTDSIRKINRKKSVLISKTLSLVIIPAIIFSISTKLGKNLSNKITEYQTITRTLNLDTGQIIGEPIETYDEKETTYVATVSICSPWQAKANNSGYIQNVTTYEYIGSNNITSNYHLTKEELEGNIIKKYEYIEHKEILEESDSLTESTILLTETFQNKNINRKSTKFIIPFSITGAILGILVDTLLIYLANFGLLKTQKRLEELNYEKNLLKLTKLELIETIKKMSEEINELKTDYNNTVMQYGNVQELLTSSEIELPWIQDDKKKIKTKRD